MSVFKKALGLLVGNTDELSYLKMPKKSQRPLKTLTERELIQLESEIGRELFGPIPKDHRREFFNLDEKTWIWYEEYLDESGQKKSATTRYEVHDTGILKAQEGARYSYLEGAELENLNVAVQLYREKVMRDIYHKDPDTGQSLA